MKWLKHAALAASLLISSPVLALDLSGSATDLGPIGLPGYLALRFSCPAADSAALVTNIADLNVTGVAYNATPGNVFLPTAGRPNPYNYSGIPSDPTHVYGVVVWVAGDLPPTMGGDGQPIWPSDCMANTGSTGMDSAGANFGILGAPMGAGVLINGW